MHCTIIMTILALWMTITGFVYCDNRIMTINEFLVAVIQHANGGNNCVYYIFDETQSSEIIALAEQIFNERELPVIIGSRNAFFEDIYTNDQLCDSYVVMCDNLPNCVRDYLQNDTRQFERSSRILMFLLESPDYDAINIKSVIGTLEYDVMLVEKSADDQRGNYHRMDPTISDETNVNVTVTSLTPNKILLAKWSRGVATFLRRGLNLAKWQPQFDENVTFTATTFHCPPYVYCKDGYPYEGVDFRIYREITRHWRTSVNCIKSDSHAYDVLTTNTKLGVSNVAFCSLWAATQDSSIDITNPYAQICASFLVPKPQLLPKFTFVLQPFQFPLWYLCTGFVFITAAVFYAVDVLYGRMVNLRFYSSFSHAFIETVRILTLGSSKRTPGEQQYVFRMSIMLFWSFALLLSTAYSAGITSALASPRYTKPINTLADMADNGIQWGTTHGSLAVHYKKSPDATIRRIANNFVLEATDEVKLERIRRNNYGTFVKLLSEKYVTDTEMLDENAKTHLKALSQCIGEYFLVFALQRNSHYLNAFNRGISSLVEHGLIQYWYKLIRNKYGLKYFENFYIVRTKNKNIPLNYERLLGLLYFFLCSNLIAFVVFVFEFIVHYYNNRQI